MRNKKLVDELDLLTRVLIQWRDKWTCQKSGIVLSPFTAEVHHVFTKKANPTLRFDFMNLILLSKKEHQNWHKNQLIYLDWFATEYPTRYEYLLKQKNIVKPYIDYDKLISERLEIIKSLELT